MKLIMRNEPNFQKSQLFITLIKAKDYNEKMKLDTWSKRTQTNPIQSQFLIAVRVAKPNQTQSKPKSRLSAIACLSSVALAKEEATAEAWSRDLLKQPPALPDSINKRRETIDQRLSSVLC
jgi:hypothetical protein